MGHALAGRYKLASPVAETEDLRDGGFEARVEEAWFSAKVDRKALKALMRRSDKESLRHFVTWLGFLAFSGTVAFLTWGTVWCVPAFALYGVLYAASDHSAHELSHGTPFKTRWLNEALYHLSAFMTLHEGVYWRWSHTRHHTDTLQVGKDPEIAVPRPPDIAGMLLDVFYIKSGFTQLRYILNHAMGRLSEDGKHFVPELERGKVLWLSRLYVAIFLAVIVLCIVTHSILPAMFVFLPRFYGGFLAQLFNITQHAGLAEDIRDHRLNTRSFYMNPAFRFLYMNMNYHIEHHMFPMVPFYNLPQLHEMIKDQCPVTYSSLWTTYQEIIPAVRRQVSDPSFFVLRALPEEDRPLNLANDSGRHLAA
jgi:fatty acid desaturase